MSGRDRWYGATMVEDNGPRIDLQNSASASHQAIKGRVTYFIVVTRPVNSETAEAQVTGHPRVSQWDSPGAAAATQVASKRGDRTPSYPLPRADQVSTNAGGQSESLRSEELT
jgi:hypothetical protein